MLREEWEYLGNEKSLLESIIGQYPAASKTKQGKEQFVSNMDSILQGVRKQAEVKEQQRDRERKARDELSEQHAQLMDKQRSYYRAVKEFQEQCFLNEKLLEMLDGEGGGEETKQQQQNGGEEEKRPAADDGA